MVSDVGSLYKVLKDDTNKKILVLINENGNLSYTGLMEKLAFITEGMLNFHLKVLDNLLSKNEENQYMLTERGQSALKLLEEFPEKFKRKNLKQIWCALGLVSVISFIVVLVFYSQGYIDSRWFNRSFGTLIGLTISFPFVYYISEVDITSERSKKKRIVATKLFCTILGSLAGLLIAMIGLAIVYVISVYVGDPKLLQVINSTPAFDYFYFGGAAVIGCLTGYCIGKKFVKTRF